LPCKPRQSTKTTNLPVANMVPPPGPRALRAANRPRRRRSQRSLDATKWNRGSTSGILCLRSCPSRQDSEPRNPRATRRVAGRRRLQRKRRDTRRPTQQRSRLCQSLPPNGSGFSGLTKRLRLLSESLTRQRRAAEPSIPLRCIEATFAEVCSDGGPDDGVTQERYSPATDSFPTR